MILGDVIERNDCCFPNHPVLLFEGRVITHGGFASRVRRLINALVAMGCKRQDRIAVLSRNCPEFLEVYGAAALGGFIGVGVNYRLSAPEQADILLDAAPEVLMYEPEYASRVEELRKLMPPSVRYVCFGPATSWSLAYEDVMSGADDGAPSIRAEADDTLFLIYTSGTTGKPKGVMLGNGGQLEQARAQAISHCAAQTDRMLIVMPFYHIGGPTELLTYLVTGSTIVLHRTFDAHAILQSMQDHGVTSAHLAPTMIQMVLELQEKTPYDLSKLHTIVYASAPMSVALSRRARAAFGPIFMQIYGMSELGLGSVLLKHQHILDGTPAEVKRLASAGQPYLGTDMKITGKDGKECAVGETGDLLMRSSALMQGYWNRPEQTREAMPADGFLRTGDMGYFDEDGFLFIVDRKKDMVVSGGENIYSREVEEVLLQHPAIAEAAVIGVPDPKWGESVMAFVVLRSGMTVTEEEAVEHCKKSLASYKKPKFFKAIEVMPRVVSTNKIDKRALRAPFWAGSDRQVS
ncbi:MAG: AMP-binding protein [Pseudomonadota bacterium]